MRVLIIADEPVASRERDMLARLEIGLADEGVRVAHAIPERAAATARTQLYSHQLTFDDRRLPFGRAWRARQLAGRLEEIAERAEPPVDLVHALGERAWTIALDLGVSLGVPVVVELPSPRAAQQLARLALPVDGSVAAFVPGAPLERAAREAGLRVPIRVVPWGVHALSPRPEPRPASGVRTMLLVASGADRAAVEQCLEGLAKAAPALGEFIVFACADAFESSGLWSRAAARALRGRITLAPDLEARREPGLRGEALLLPEALGEHRSLTLDAMGHAMAVIARADPLVADLIDGRTARLVMPAQPAGAADAWAEAIAWLAREPDAAARLGASAWEHVRAHRRASAHVSALLAGYQWLLGADRLPFAGGAGAS